MNFIVKEYFIFTCITNMVSQIDLCITTRQNISKVNQEIITRKKLQNAQEFLHSIQMSYTTDDEDDYMSDADTDID